MTRTGWTVRVAISAALLLLVWGTSANTMVIPISSVLGAFALVAALGALLRNHPEWWPRGRR